MLFKSIYLENFRLYKGPVEFELSTDDKKINVIQGNNDAGKTTMLNAITWCLYGEERNNISQDLYNSHTFKNTKIGDIITVKVVITMLDSDGREVEITRSNEYVKINDDHCSSPEQTFTIFRDDGVNDQVISFPTDYINTHLPSSLKDYFLFDGELLAQFFKKDNGNIKQDVFRLSQINLIKKVSTHIKNRKNEFIDEKEEKQPQVARILRKIDGLENDIIRYSEDMEREKKAKRKYKTKITELKEQWKALGDKDPLELFDEKNALIKKQERISDDTKDAETAYKKELFDDFSKIYGYSILKGMEKRGEELKEEGFIPAQYRKGFLEFLMNREECICGRSIVEGTPEYQEVKDLFDKTDEITDISELINKLLGKVESVMSNYPEDFIEIDNSLDQRIMDLEDDYEDLQGQIDELDALINTGISEDEIRKLKEDIEYYERMLKQAEKNFIKAETKKADAEDNLKKAGKEHEQIINKVGNLDELDDKIQFCTDVYNTSEKLYADMKVYIHDKLQNITTTEFKTYHWKTTYKGVDIDDDFNVEFIRKDGTHVSATDPSAGTQLTLALSFITALNNLAGFKLPIIIDTPLGRLDNDIRYNLGKFLPEYTKDTQVLLLSTGNEYSGDFKKNIIEHVGRTYKLDVIEIDDQEITDVIPVKEE